MKRLLPLIFFAALAATATAQDLTLTFTSVSDAKFFVYVNGRLYNQRSSGMVTVRNLEEKDYHFRVVIDDPYEIAVTKTIKPDRKHNEYNVLFNAVRERVYLRQATTSSQRRDDESAQWLSDDSKSTQAPAEESKPRARARINRPDSQDSATQQVINHLRTQTTLN